MNAILFADATNAWLLAGWTMIHFLWLGTLVAMAAFFCRWLLRRASANLRYAVSIACLSLLAALPVAIASWLHAYSPPSSEMSTREHSPAVQLESAPRSKSSAAKVAVPNPPPNATPAQHEIIDLRTPKPLPTAIAPAEAQPRTSQPSAANLDAAAPSPPAPSPQPLVSDSLTFAVSAINTAVRYLPWLWLIGTPLTFAFTATGVVGTRRLRGASRPIADGPIAENFARLAASLRLGKRVTVAVCDRIAAPVLIGILRPIILLPPAAVTGYSPDEIEMVLLHELAHVRRWDNLINLLQRLIEALLFFHPAVWLVSNWVRREREACCDELVVARTQHPHAYAELLVALAAQMPRSVLFHPAASSAMAAGPLRSRIRRILQLDDDPMLISGKSFLLVLAGLLTATALAVLYMPTIGQAEPSAAELNDANPQKISTVADALEEFRKTAIGYGLDLGAVLPQTSWTSYNEARLADYPTRDVWPRVLGHVDTKAGAFHSVREKSKVPQNVTGPNAYSVPLTWNLATREYATLLFLKGIEKDAHVICQSYTSLACFGPMAGNLIFTSYATALVNGEVSGQITANSYFNLVITGKLTGQITAKSYAMIYLMGGFEGNLELNRSKVYIAGRTSKSDLSRITGSGQVWVEKSDLPSGEHKFGQIVVTTTDSNSKAPELAEASGQQAEREPGAEQLPRNITELDKKLVLLQEQLRQNPSDERLKQSVVELAKSLAEKRKTSERDVLEKNLKNLQGEIKRKFQDYYDIAKGMGRQPGNDSQDPETQLLLRQIADTQTKIENLTSAYMQLETDYRVAKGELSDPELFAAQADELVKQDPQYAKLQQQLADVRKAPSGGSDSDADSISRKIEQYRADFKKKTIREWQNKPNVPLQQLAQRFKTQAASMQKQIAVATQALEQKKKELEARLSKSIDLETGGEELNRLQQKANDMNIRLQGLAVDSETPKQNHKVQSDGQPAGVDVPSSPVKPLSFALKRDDAGKTQLYLNGKPVSNDDVRRIISQNGAPAGDLPVSLSADKGINYAEVMKVVDLLESLGLKKLSLDTRHVEAPDAAREIDAQFKAKLIVREDNPMETKTHDVPRSIRKMYRNMLDGLRSDPYGPQLKFGVKWNADHSRVVITAPKEVQEAIDADIRAMALAEEGHSPKAVAAMTSKKEQLIATLPPDWQTPQNLQTFVSAYEAAEAKSLRPQIDRHDGNFVLLGTPQPTEKDWPAILGEPPRKERVIAEKAWKELGLKLVPLNPTETFYRESTGKPAGILIVAGNVPKGLPLPSILTKADGEFITNFDGLLQWVEQHAGGPPIKCYAMSGDKEYLFESQRPEIAATDLNQLTRNTSRPPATTHKFPSLEDQKLADLAWKRLKLELEPIDEDSLKAVKALGYEGGVLVTGSDAVTSQYKIESGAILLGLHVWPTRNMKDVAQILQREDLEQFNPLKFYVVPAQYVNDQGQTSIADVVTGRISVLSNDNGFGGDERQIQSAKQSFSEQILRQALDNIEGAKKAKDEATRMRNEAKDPQAAESARLELEAADRELETAKREFEQAKRGLEEFKRAKPSADPFEKQSSIAAPRPYTGPPPTSASPVGIVLAEQKLKEAADKLTVATKAKQDALREFEHANGPQEVESARHQLEAADDDLESAKRQFEEAKRELEELTHAKTFPVPPDHSSVTKPPVSRELGAERRPLVAEETPPAPNTPLQPSAPVPSTPYLFLFQPPAMPKTVPTAPPGSLNVTTVPPSPLVLSGSNTIPSSLKPPTSPLPTSPLTTAPPNAALNLTGTNKIDSKSKPLAPTDSSKLAGDSQSDSHASRYQPGSRRSWDDQRRKAKSSDASNDLKLVIYTIPKELVTDVKNFIGAAHVESEWDERGRLLLQATSDRHEQLTNLIRDTPNWRDPASAKQRAAKPLEMIKFDGQDALHWLPIGLILKQDPGSGVYVVHISNGSPAAWNDMQMDDVITKVGNFEVPNLNEFESILKALSESHPKSNALNFTIRRQSAGHQDQFIAKYFPLRADEPKTPSGIEKSAPKSGTTKEKSAATSNWPRYSSAAQTNGAASSTSTAPPSDATAVAGLVTVAYDVPKALADDVRHLPKIDDAHYMWDDGKFILQANLERQERFDRMLKATPKWRDPAASKDRAKLSVALVENDDGQEVLEWRTVGLSFVEETLSNHEGARVLSVAPGSPADWADVQPGDDLVEIGNFRVGMLHDLDSLLITLSKDAAVTNKMPVGFNRWVSADGYRKYERQFVIRPDESKSTPANQKGATSTNSSASPSPQPTPKSLVLFDGATFQHWQDSWQREINPEKRIEAVKAIAAFGAHGYGPEAATTLLNQVQDYLSAYGESSKTPEARLLTAVEDALGSKIPMKDWLPPLRERYDADPTKWETLANQVLLGRKINDEKLKAETQKFLLRLAHSQNANVANNAIETLTGEYPAYSANDEVRQILLKRFSGSDRASPTALRWFSGTKEFPPEVIETLLHGDHQQQAAIRKFFHEQLRKGPAQKALIDTLTGILEDESKAADHVAAIRAIGAAVRVDASTSIQDLLKKLIDKGPLEKQAAAAYAIQLITRGSVPSVPLLKGKALDPAGKPLDNDAILNLVNMESLTIFVNAH
jgi:beta-lactamase regulating signal transducer with metallopeptidase domain/biopolymer transport protein ExbD/C-terminal processing protease CtpA/Prc